MMELMKITSSKLKWIPGLFMILFISSCSQEFKLAHQFIRHHKGTKIIIVPSYELYKDNLTISYDTSCTYNKFQLDSIAWAQSVYVRHISDSVLLTRFTGALINELTREGFDVYIDDGTGSIKQLTDIKWFVNIAQLQIVEKHSITGYEVFSEKVEGYVQEFADLRLNMVNLSSWFEAGRSDSSLNRVLFLDESIMDNRTVGFDFVLNKGTRGLQQNRDSLELEDIYRFAGESGRKHAELLFDHFMNEYITEKSPAGYPVSKYYYYDRKRNYLIKGLNLWSEVPDQ